MVRRLSVFAALLVSATPVVSAQTVPVRPADASDFRRVGRGDTVRYWIDDSLSYVGRFAGLTPDQSGMMLSALDQPVSLASITALDIGRRKTVPYAFIGAVTGPLLLFAGSMGVCQAEPWRCENMGGIFAVSALIGAGLGAYAGHRDVVWRRLFTK